MSRKRLDKPAEPEPELSPEEERELDRQQLLNMLTNLQLDLFEAQGALKLLVARPNDERTRANALRLVRSYTGLQV